MRKLKKGLFISCLLIGIMLGGFTPQTLVAQSKTEPASAVKVSNSTNASIETEKDSLTMLQDKVADMEKVQKKAEDKEKENDIKADESKYATKFISQMALLLIIIYFGIRFGGVALGLLGGLGVTILVFGFRILPGDPPIDVMLIILAVVATSSTLEATGALGTIVKFAEKLLRKNPKYIVYLAPLSTFVLTMLTGTGHAVYPLLPVIYDVAYKQKVRPERPMAIASVASQMGITASPIAAAAAAVIAAATTAKVDISLMEILRVTVPACLIGMLVAATWSLKRGKELMEDPDFLAKMQDPKMKEFIEGDLQDDGKSYNKKDAKIALAMFLFGIVSIITVASFPKTLLPLDEDGKPVSMTIVLQFIMLAVGAIIIFLTRVKAKAISDTKVFNAGMIAVIMIFGIAWMSETVIKSNKFYLLYLIKDVVSTYPWMFAISMFVISIFLKSQAAVLVVMMPVGFALGLPKEVLIGCIPASYAYFFFCFYPSDLATINFDRTGTTKIGKYILNHSFMMPGLIGVSVATVIAYLLSTVVY